MTKKWDSKFGAPPKTGYKPPEYKGKLSENTSKHPRWQMKAYRNSLFQESEQELSWKEELELWQNKVKELKQDFNLSGKSILELKSIFNNLKDGKEWDYTPEKLEVDEKENERIRGLLLK